MSPASGLLGIGVAALLHPAGEIGEPPRLDRRLHRPRHQHRVLGLGDRGVHQHAVAAQLHRLRGVARGADAGVDQHRHARAFDDQPDGHAVLDSEPRADRRAQAA